MGYERNMNPVPNPPREKPNARKHGRVRSQTITCSLGEVIDISASGMKVRMGNKPGFKPQEEVPITVNGVNNPFEIRAKFAWARRNSLFKWTAGFQFGTLPDEVRKELLEIARIAAIGEKLRPADEHYLRPQ
jgi:PilZ domain